MGKRILVSGNINIETTLAVDGFPLDYFPVTYPFFGVRSTVAGVGYNIASALKSLGHTVDLLSLVGDDHQADWVEAELKALGLPSANLCRALQETCQSVILHEPSGRRQIHTDLKNCQQVHFPEATFLPALERCDLALLCNINFSRDYLQKARAMGKLVATDVHVLNDLKDDYNRDFMAAADILFLSDEGLDDGHEAFIRELAATYHNRVIVMGRGRQGALMYLRDQDSMVHNPAYTTREVVNTVGAGDSLFSAFLHGFVTHGDPRKALHQACLFASWKVGTRGAAEGFLSDNELTELDTNREYETLS